MKYFSFVLIFFLFCTQTRDKIPTGITRIDKPDGITLIAIGRASENAIQKDSITMKEVTSKEAAMLLLKAEFSKNEYDKIRDKFKIESIEFFNEKEYCKITAIYKN